MKFCIALLPVITVSCLMIESKPAEKKECTARGEYCQNHWECCSKSCMSYLYKCVGEDKPGVYEPPIFYPPHVTDQDPANALTLDELIDNVFGEQD